MVSPRKRNQIISSDESSDDENSGFRNKNSLVSDDSQPINKNRKGKFSLFTIVFLVRGGLGVILLLKIL